MSIVVAIYARVSTTDQNCDMQLTDLRDYAVRRDWKVFAEYVDTGWSGSKASRPQLDKLLKDAREHRFDCVLVYKLDRFGRSVVNLAQQLQDLTSWGVRFIATTQGIDTDQSNPTSRLLLHILAAVAEFEREIIKERVNAGVAEYRRAYRDGRVGKTRHSRSEKDLAHGRPEKVFRRDLALELRQAGKSWRAIAIELKVPVSTIRRAVAAAQNGA